jgi:hypothetical protein
LPRGRRHLQMDAHRILFNLSVPKYRRPKAKALASKRQSGDIARKQKHANPASIALKATEFLRKAKLSLKNI